jgi:hypothetical protein
MRKIFKHGRKKNYFPSTNQREKKIVYNNLIFSLNDLALNLAIVVFVMK